MKTSHFVLRIAWLCAALLATTVSVAGATTINVQFYTEAVFYLDGADPTTGTTFIEDASHALNISFAGVGTSGSPMSVMSDDLAIVQNLGTFTVSRVKDNSQFDLSGYSFQLSIFQSVPSVGTGALVGLLDGKFKQDGKIDFSGDFSTTIGDVNYTLTNLASGNVMSLANLAIGESYSKALDSNITHTHPETTGDDGGATAVPEPASLSLLGVGLAGIGTGARRRRQRKAS